MLPSPDLRQIYAALRQKIHLSSCPNFPGQLSARNTFRSLFDGKIEFVSDWIDEITDSRRNSTLSETP
jgi:hypothetical protein